MLAREHVSAQDTLTRQHVFSTKRIAVWNRRICLQGLTFFIFFLKNFNAEKKKVFAEKIEFLNSVENQVFVVQSSWKYPCGVLLFYVINETFVEVPLF